MWPTKGIMPLPEVMALETRQEAILDQLAQLKQQITGLREGLKQSITSIPQRSRKLTVTNIPAQNGLIHDIVINASPKHPPYSILALYHLWGDTLKLNISCHVHSTVRNVPEHLLSFRPTDSTTSKNSPLLNITVVWKEADRERAKMYLFSVSPSVPSAMTLVVCSTFMGGRGGGTCFTPDRSEGDLPIERLMTARKV
uniref:AIMP2 thioredoxin-like domain-containing protein n=1 Tax=Timema monikensis TaxID=170555 RepID=A0A7R9HQY4_9NEOP|nr:unnamed protein product [Timema monikensis]